MSGITLEGKSCIEPDDNNWKVDIKSQYGFENSPLAKINHDTREQLIAEYIKKQYAINNKIIFGLQEISDSQYEIIVNILPKTLLIERTTLKQPGDNKIAGVIIYDSNVYLMEQNLKVVKYGEKNNNNYIYFATFNNLESIQNFIYVNTHAQFGNAQILT